MPTATAMKNDYKVKDISLADWGRKEIELAEKEGLAVTNGTEVIITVAIEPGDPQRFVDILTYSRMSMQFDIPTAFAAGTLYPSNTWNLASITNGLRAGDIITVNSNGLKLVDVWMSNSVPVLKPRW